LGIENKLIISKKHLLLLAGVWMAMQAYVLSYNNGIITGGEAPKYFGQAKIYFSHAYFLRA